jgi:hypothetical protein
MICWLRRTFDANPPWQIGTRECLPDAIAANVGDISKVVEEAKCLQDGGIDADTDICITGFDPL